MEERTAELKQSTAEQGALLREVHHRVRNNLQLVCSLLSMQIASSAGDSFSGPLNDALSLVFAMSLIHEQVYRSEMLADLDFGQCVELLADRLFGTYCVDPSRIRLEVKVEAIRMPADDAIPCGLILNELLANSLKHAFGDDREGVIRVLLKKTEDGSAELTVADNGVGLPDNFQWNEAQSLGLRLVRILIHQLRADLFVSGHDGATFRFAWKLPAPLPVAMQCV